ncbi:hypothetical protein [Lactiplantibacillus daowaiensis]|uniref:Uncharacterized protein n=1 Tax=Lactiplantibacillus daowaiensis TaxID=2559918 RepID=A0ABW1S0N6_9LACO|nr:hypothetical protein [Lactiplantibacillus daowaiensis]
MAKPIAASKTTLVKPTFDHLLVVQDWTIQELKLADLLVPLIASEQGVSGLVQLTSKIGLNCQKYQTPVKPSTIGNSKR